MVAISVRNEPGVATSDHTRGCGGSLHTRGRDRAASVPGATLRRRGRRAAAVRAAADLHHVPGAAEAVDALAGSVARLRVTGERVNGRAVDRDRPPDAVPTFFTPVPVALVVPAGSV